MRLTRIDDPRDNLDKADRDQLYRFAVARGVKEIDDRIYNGANAASLMRMILRQKGITDLQVPYHQLGMAPYRPMEEPSGKPAQTVEEMLREQLKEVQSRPPEPKPQAFADMTMGELRRACKVNGIKGLPTDNKAKLLEKLSGQAAS